ncbi:MAG: bifunctional folylpolyglutamate synthase/dihydrofolate synthase [Anaerolineales bacterium]|nr:bifunctional folylpolyglutamate synthase/dihydrofolate synthase [Anaerolineales bacterium]
MDTETAYNLALDYLYSFVDYSLKHASELAKADFNLERMFALMDMLDNPQTKYPILHVAGTKGKGSVSALAASALKAAGYKTGLYTSPHLQDYCERIQVNGQPIPHGELAELVEEIKPAVARVPFLTTFEITTALGFLYFARQNCEAAVIEVGLGGRLDATNIVMPRVSVITSLSLDHTLVLGDTLAQIAGEKAGIIKPGVPVVSASQKDEALEVLVRIADERGCDLTLVGRDVEFKSLSHSLDGQAFQLSTFNLPPLHLTIPLLGIHQAENAAVAYAALKTSGLNVPDESIRKGFAELKWPARFDILRRDPPVVLDVAHNRESALRLRQTLDVFFPDIPVILLFCTLEDKDIAGMLAELSPRVERVVATQADHPRAPSAEWIAEQVEKAGLAVEAVTPVPAALERALELAGDRKLVLTAGSVAFAGEVSAAWQKRGG